MSSSKKQRKRKAAQKVEQEKLLQLSESELHETLAIIADDVYEEQEEQEQDEEGKELSSKLHLMAEEATNPFGGSQSWAGLDKFLNAAATSNAVRQTTFEFKTMVNNVLNDEELSLTEKEARITALASGFSRRAGKLADEKKEIDDPGTVEVLLDKIGLKQITKREGGANFNASDFADVPDRSKPSTWKLRLAEGRSGNFTVAQVARAITAMQPSGFRGRKVQIGSSKGAVTRKISGAINKIKGASDAQKKTLRERLAKVKSTGFEVTKDLEGNYRAFGWVSNKWRDRDVQAHPKGEIISEAAHKEFVSWAWENIKERGPELWLWHTPKTAMSNRADWIDYADGFLLASWPLTKEEGEQLVELGKSYDQAMSHGFFKADYDTENGIINKYRSFEGSALPREHVANEWTDFATLAQEAKEMFTDERRGYLVSALGEEKVAELEASTKDLSEELKELGIEFKATEIPVEEVPKEEPKEETKTVEVKPEDGKKKDVDPSSVLDVKAIMEALGLDQLSEYLESQEKTMGELKTTVDKQNTVISGLKKSDDEKIAQAITPRVEVEKDIQPVWLKRLSQSDETKVDAEEDKELIESTPGQKGSWVSEVMGPATDSNASVPM